MKDAVEDPEDFWTNIATEQIHYQERQQAEKWLYHRAIQGIEEATAEVDVF